VEPSRVLSDRYALISHLARGGMADVWIAEDQVLGRQVAVKIMHTQYATSDAFVERFRRESQAAANLSHSNIVAVHDWGQDGDTYFMVMELVQGRNLRDVIRSEGALLPRRVAEIGAEVGVALSVAHNQGLVHRDIKPANVLLTPDGAVKVADFGIARAWDDSEQLTKTGAVIGTATYFSPEQAQGETADSRSDIYSLGVVMYELLTGRPPFSGESPVAVAYQHVQQPPEPPSEIDPNVPPGLEAIVLKAMAKNPDDRYQTAAAMVEDIDRLLAGQVPLAAPQNEAPTRVVTAAGGIPPVPPPVPGGDPYDSGAPTEAYDEPVYAEPGSMDRTTLTIGIIAAAALLILGIILLLRLLGSGGTDRPIVPDLRGMEVAEAIDRLTDLGLEAEQETVADTEIEPGLVAGTDPPEGTQMVAGSLVTLFVSGGPADVEVPRVIDLTEEQARQAIENANLEVGEVTYEASPVVELGIVMAQSPTAGELTTAGADVDLVVSAGTDALIVPDLVGKSEGDALFTLQQEGFQVDQLTIERRPSADVLEGFVIETDPAAGGAVPTGGSVTVVISEGAVPSVVPSVITFDPDDAQELLEELGFVVIFDDPLELEWDDPLDGTIAEQDPSAGSTAEFGSTIRLKIGEAATEVTVPDVLGDGPTTARNAIQAAGLTYEVGPPVELGVDDPADGTAVEQSPPPSSVRPVGTIVVVRFGQAAQPATVPDLAGDGLTTCLTEGQAIDAINAQNLTPVAGNTFALPLHHPCIGRVVAQTPDPLTVVAEGSQVTYRLGVGAAGEGVYLAEDEIIGMDIVDILAAFPNITWVQDPDPDDECTTSDSSLWGMIAWFDPVPDEVVPAGTEVTYWLGSETEGSFSCNAPPTPLP
jgi:beta-lactam-binding protein with PASTA domain/tRNA A-37 threonylcarbamoyl transferase component Bud32